MARFNRDFLKIYFEDICTLYIAKRKIYQKYKALDQEIVRLEKGSVNPTPVLSPDEPILTFGRFLSLLFGISLSGLYLFGVFMYFIDGLSEPGFFFAMLIMVAIGIFAIICPINIMRGVNAENKRMREVYYEKLEHYHKVKENDRLARNKIPELIKQIKQCENDYSTIEGLIEKAYSANILPNQYRTIYAVFFLYEYFQGSQEDDIAQALQLFVMEEIKAKLDKIIANQTRIINNQHDMLRSQEDARIDAQNQREIMINKLNRIEATEEERKSYEQAIETRIDTELAIRHCDFRYWL